MSSVFFKYAVAGLERIKLLAQLSRAPRNTLGLALNIYKEYNHGLLPSRIESEGRDVWPWYTYAATEFLRQFDYSNSLVLEYGSGYSTLFWAKRARRVIAIEHNPAWAQSVQQIAPKNVEVRFLTEGVYELASLAPTEHPDLIIIDGAYRYKCACRAVDIAQEHTVIVLDNSDWCEKTVHLLRDAGFLQFDFHGFGPFNTYTWTTSIYFRSWSLRRLSQTLQPVAAWRRPVFSGEFGIPD